jgi:hypothetical protein
MRTISFFVFITISTILSAQTPNVGIGTTNPQKSLHVKGEIRFDTLTINPGPGLIIHNQGGDIFSLKFNGNPGTFLSGSGQWLNGPNGGNLPVSSIVLSDKHPNQDLIQAGYSFLGNTSLGNAEIDTIELINGNSWVQMPLIGAPAPKQKVKVVWGGDRLYVFDGYPSNHFSYYLPDSNRWFKLPPRPLESNNIADMAGVYTNNKFIVFGGVRNYSTPINDGFIFDPSTNGWSPMSKINAPLKREPLYTWTGTELIIWSGKDNNYVLTNSGHIYNPSTNSWREMTLTNAPEGRILSEPSESVPQNLCVFTGTDLIIWGGTDGNSTYYNTGAKYNVQNNIWSSIATPATNILKARNGHSIVWTGTEMIIWGGG